MRNCYREVSDNTTSEGTESRNKHRVGDQYDSFRGKTTFTKLIRWGRENPSGAEAVA